MATITILDNEFATLWHHEEEKIVHHQFHKFIYGDPFHEVLNSVMDLIKQHRIHKWLSDDRKNSAIPLAEMEWLKNEWKPQAIKAGWKYWAVVPPEKKVGQMSIERIIQHLLEDTDVVAKSFSDPASAQKWLEEQ